VLPVALADCDTAVAANPTDAIARGNRGFFRQQRGDDAAAKADYDAALALDPALEVARAGLASLASGETGAQRSLEGIERALELKPGDTALRYERATQLQKLRRFDEALADGERAVSAAPQDIRYRERVCELLAQRGDFQRTEPECRRLLELDASNGVACNLLAAICMQQGRNEEALGLL
jgi:Flp pilus assembly protein TadD